jgi:hypothetical protein
MHRSKQHRYSITSLGCARSDDGIVTPNAFAVFQVDDQIEFDWGSFHRLIVRVGTLQQAIYNASWAHP